MVARVRWCALWLMMVLIFASTPVFQHAAVAGPAPQGPLPPGAPKTVLDDGLVYVADGRKVGLLRRTDAIAVALRAPASPDNRGAADAALARLIGAGGALADFVPAEALTVGLRVLASPAAAGTTDQPGLQRGADRMTDALAAARGAPDVAWAASVYVNAETGTTQVADAAVIVALRPGQDAARFFGRDPRWSGFRPLPGTPDQYIGAVAAGGGDAAVLLANALSGDGRVAWASPNFYQGLTQDNVDDPLLPQQWHLENTGQNGGTPDADVDAAEAWAITPGGSSDVVVAVVDDGMEYTHPDLAPNLFRNPAEIAGNNVDDDGNGWVDDTNGWDFTAGDNFPGASSGSDAHATSVGGVIAAAGDNGVGVAGIAYRSRLLPVRIFGDTGSATSDANIASAIYYAAGRTASGGGTWRAADIMNLSWGGGAPSTVLSEALAWATTSGRAGKGTVAFAATGNSYLSTISYPAALAGSLGGLIAVGASTNRDVRASYSNYGSQLDFVAPSSGPTSGGTFGIVTVDRVGANGYAQGDYTVDGEFGGTSSATPLAAGIGALVLARDPGLTASEVRGLMRNTTDLIGPQPYVSGTSLQYGHGRVNAGAAVRGVGVAEIQVLDGALVVESGGTAQPFSALRGQSQTRTLLVRNQGTLALDLADLSVGPGPFSVAAGFSDTTLGVGETATIGITFAPSAGGPASGSLSFSSSDGDEGAFTINLTGTGVVASVSGYAFEDWDGDGARDADESVLAGRQVYLDANGNGQLDRTTATASPGTTIPDNDATGIASAQTITGLVGSVTDVDVELTVAHAYVGDLEISLVSPAGVTVPLIRRRGGAGVNFTATVLDDEAPTSITTVGSSAAPFTGSYRPESPLAALDGQDPNGEWQLRLVDRAAAGVGTLVSWSLSITTEPVAFTDSGGYYAFLSLPPGTYAVRAALGSGWNGTSPPGGGYTATVVDADTALPNRDFGLVLQNAIYGQQYDDLDGDGARDPDEPGLAGWRVYMDQNRNGAYDLDDVVTTSPNTPIPDNAPAGIASGLLVSGQSGPIRDLNVRITLTHTFVSDLEISLVSPAGVTVPLIRRRGSAGDNFIHTVLDDEAPTSITTIGSSAAPFTGSYRPESPLAVLDGAERNGEWQLVVADRVQRDTGTLVSWSLIFENEATAITPASGKYRFRDLLPGEYVVRQVERPQWRPTAPVDGSYTVDLAPGATSTGNEFGHVADSAPPAAEFLPFTAHAATGAVESVGLRFDEAVTGVALADFVLLRAGQPVALAGATLSGSGAYYTLTGVADLLAPPGTYQLTLTAAGSGIADLAQNELAEDATVTWTAPLPLTSRLVFFPVLRTSAP